MKIERGERGELRERGVTRRKTEENRGDIESSETDAIADFNDL